ncbi:LacI family DNA-binding transcriptional regulator [Robertmurraya korlensis]|uniref:LacI family DNA-binding transcriptional regulator n=1 Tax=Robertmurraya korlensis TaxID=519977 RepID=UPI000824FE0A|nr:LacI family DNA-binding transcriptional regulator [Robertmurraya korlensis]
MTTIADIARIAGVAKSTVSRYLNGGSIGDATKLKIERVIKETGYVPNTFAQSLKAKKTSIIGTVVPRLDSFASARTLIGIDEQLREAGCQMVISNTSQDEEREIESLYSFARQKVAGIILLATKITDQHLEAFKKIDIPIILVGQKHQAVYSIIHQDYEAAKAMGKHVLEKGHSKIAYLGVTPEDISVGVQRRDGFKDAISSVDGCEVRYFETGFGMGDALKKATTIIEDFNPSIIVCATDNIALGVCKAAYVKGLDIPKDLSVTGFGGYEVTEYIHPSLTTVKYEFKQAGKTAAQKMLKLIEGEAIEKITYINFELISRGSVDSFIKHEL